MDTFADFLDRRHAELLAPLFVGLLLARGPRTVTSWFRAGGLTDDFRRDYTLLGTFGRSTVDTFAAVLFSRLRRTLDPGPRWLFARDDTPTQRYGSCVEGAGLHHNPTPGPAHQRFHYGLMWVTTAWVVHHPRWDRVALPLSADLYIRAKARPAIDADHRLDFRTKLPWAADQIRWTAQQVRGTDKPLGFVVDGAYGKRPVLKEAKAQGGIVVSRLRRDAALWDLPPDVPAGQARPGRPRKYGTRRLHLAKRAAHPQGWQQVVCWQYQQQVTKTVKTFLATYKPVGGVIRVVIVKEDDGWRA